MYDPKFGGYATSITVDEHFTFHVPASIPDEVAGPLLCAGITTYAPLARNVKAGDRVGVVGIGGLGHMALQYAAAMGCETWAISTSASKEAEARKFGATHFLVSSDAAQMAAAKRTFDFVLCCASGEGEGGRVSTAVRAAAVGVTVFCDSFTHTTLLPQTLVFSAGDFNADAYLKLLKPLKAFCLVGLPAVATPVKVRGRRRERERERRGK